ncbi:hypothetical protein [Puia dinghuensis]|nr:hypothetical protein [Puia dinghuensis]
MKKAICLGLCFPLVFFSVEAQVNPQNGAAEINIPLYSYKDAANRLELDASLVYVDGNGLKVSEMASAVGTGWALNCGGLIQRIQHGEPDDQKMNNPPPFVLPPPADQNIENPQYASSYYPDGYLYTTYSPSDMINNQGAYSPYEVNFSSGVHGYKEPPEILADRDQDVFQFSFNGRTGQFVIGKNMQVVTLNDSKLQISFQTTDMSASNIRTRISQFTITDESGIQYVFKDMELGYVSSYTDFRQTPTDNADIGSLLQLGFSMTGAQGSNNGGWVNFLLGTANGQLVGNKWYLSQIINPLTGKQITLNYDTYEEDKNTDKMISSGTVSGGGLGNAMVVWNRYKVRGKRLSSVILSNNERLDFSYPTPRIDLPNQSALSQLTVSYKGNTVYSWNFGYGYMVGIDGAIQSPTYPYTTQEKQWSRLCLLTLQKTGQNNISESPYKFAYNMGGDNNTYIDVIPPMFSIYQDHYGYYNAGQFITNASQDTYGSIYSISSLNTWIRNGLGVYKNVQSTIAKNGVIKSVTYPMGGVLTYSYENNVGASGILGGVRVNSTTNYDGISHNNDIIKQYKYLNADEKTSSGWGNESFTYSTPGSVTAFGCAPKQTPAGIIKEVAASYVEKSIGGIGLSQNPVSMGAAVGLEMLAEYLPGVAEAVEIAYAIYELLGGTSNPPTTTTSFTNYQSLSTNINNRLPWGYARTEEISILGSGNIGEIVYEYTSPADHAFEVGSVSVAYSNIPRYAYWVYGLPKTVTVYDQSMTHLVKQTVNHYQPPVVNQLTDPNFMSTSWSTTGSEYGCTIRVPETSSSFIQQEPRPYYPYYGHMVLLSTDETVYNSAQPQQSTTTTTNFEYDANYQLKHKYTNNSKGEKVETFYYHPYDYPQATGGIATMNLSASNILSPVISTETYINKSDGNQYMIGASATDYRPTFNGDIKPAFTYTFQNPLPVVSTALQPFNTASVLRDPNYYQQVSMFGYDNFGNVAQTITGSNRIQSSIFDYLGQLQVAEVDNASYNDIWYTSFEADGGKPGSSMNTAAIVSSDARTGNQCFNLSHPSNAGANGYFSFAGLNNTLNYIVSFWSKNGSACVTGSQNGTAIFNSCQGSSGWKQGETANGWTYYEVQVNNVDKISASGTGLIDEFRIYPVGAKMRTTTYAPLIGKTSECGVDGKVTYYQYDNMNRLRYVKDDQGNIIRMYDYNYKQ